MYCYKLNNSYTTYVSYAYTNDCIKASAKYHKANAKYKAAKAVALSSAFSPLPKNTSLRHKVFGLGKVLSTDSSGIVTVRFGEKTARFLYPDAVNKGYLSLAH